MKNEMKSNVEMRKKIGIKIIEKEVIEEESHNYKIRKVKVKNELDDFIKIQNSDATKGNIGCNHKSLKIKCTIE